MKKRIILYLLIGLITISTLGEVNATNEQNTPIDQKTAILIAKLQDGVKGVELNEIGLIKHYSNQKSDYWILKVKDRNTDEIWSVIIDANTGISKKNGNVEGSTNWRSFNELKAIYITQLYYYKDTITFQKPKEIQPDIWAVTLTYKFNKVKQVYTVYFNSKTGYSRMRFKPQRLNKWISLKELDDLKNAEHDYGDQPFRNALRDLYPES